MALRHAICSEIYQGWELAEICKSAKRIGYDGLEIAHFHLFETVEDVPPARRAEMRRTIEGEGLACAGLHWLLVSPKGFHITTSDDALRKRSWAYLSKLIDFCADLGGPVMILGSPFQRDARDGWSVDDAKGRLAEGLASLAPQAAARGVTLLMEAVPRPETNVVNTLAEAADIVKRVGHPSVQTMFDTHNTADETESLPALIEKFYPLVRHVHVNEMDGRHPGTGKLDFKAVLKFLIEKKYAGWVSLEVFKFEHGSENIARDSLGYLKDIERSLGG